MYVIYKIRIFGNGRIIRDQKTTGNLEKVEYSWRIPYCQRKKIKLYGILIQGVPLFFSYKLITFVNIMPHIDIIHVLPTT